MSRCFSYPAGTTRRSGTRSSCSSEQRRRTIGLLVGASFLDPGPQTVLWAVAIALDFSGALIGIGGWSLMPMHFAERHNLIIILALGESIIRVGRGHTRRADATGHLRRRARRRAGFGVVVDLLRHRRDRHRTTAGARPGRSAAEQPCPRRLLVRAPDHGHRHRAHRVRPRARARARSRSARGGGTASHCWVVWRSTCSDASRSGSEVRTR